MLIRKDEATASDFKADCKFMSKHNVVFAHLADTTGDSYLSALYFIEINDSDNQGNTAFVPKKPRTKTLENGGILPLYDH